MKLLYTWEQFELDFTVLLHFFSAYDYVPKTIIGISKGGLPLAVKLANHYNTDFYTIGLKSYQGTKRSKIKVYQDIPVKRLKTPILLVDDISDSGESFLYALKHLKQKVTTVSLFIKKDTKFNPRFSLHEVPKKCWVAFPWE